MQETKDGRITGFNEVNLQGKIRACEEPMTVRAGDPQIFCFMLSDDDPEKPPRFLYGTREELEPEMLRLLFEQSTHSPGDSTWISLILSSFLHLHGKTASLLAYEAERFKGKAVKFKLSQDNFISTTDLPATTTQPAIEGLLAKFSKFRSVIPWLRLDDLTLFDNPMLYLGDIHFSVDDLLFNPSTPLTPAFGELLRKNSKLFNYALTTPRVIVQEKLESLMSANFSTGTSTGELDKEQTVLEIGYKIERMLSAVPTILGKIQAFSAVGEPVEIPESARVYGPAVAQSVQVLVPGPTPALAWLSKIIPAASAIFGAVTRFGAAAAPAAAPAKGAAASPAASTPAAVIAPVPAAVLGAPAPAASKKEEEDRFRELDNAAKKIMEEPTYA
jgi:hypothetical protein